MFRAKRMKKGLVATVAAGGLLFAIASPASAAIAGDGAGTGWEYPQYDNTPISCISNPEIPIIGSVNGSEFELTHTTVMAGDNSVGVPVALFVGDTLTTIDVGEHIISPAGVSPDCPAYLDLIEPDVVPGDPPVHPLPVAIDGVTITDTDTGGSKVNCSSVATGELGHGLYTRVNTTVNFTFAANCTIVGNQLGQTATVSSATTLITISGNMSPCGPLPNPECIAAADLGVGGNPPKNDDYGSHLVTNLTAAGA